jgi:hypothetical protein
VLSGKRVEPSEVGGPGEFETMTDEELERALMERAQKLGFVLSPRRSTELPLPGTVRIRTGAEGNSNIQLFTAFRMVPSGMNIFGSSASSSPRK